MGGPMPAHIELAVNEKNRRRQDDGERQVENPRSVRLKDALAQGGGLVVLLGAVVDHVRGPKDVDLVCHPVEPVVAKVDQQKRHDPGQQRVCRHGVEVDAFVAPDERPNLEALEDDLVEDLLEQTGRDGADAVIQAGRAMLI